jgi:aspartate racemase
MIINSISAQTMLRLAAANDRSALVAYLSSALQVLWQAGAGFAACASNTPHLVFDALEQRSPLPLISIVDEARSEAVRLGMKRLGLFGTSFTMQGSFYPESFAAAGLTVVTPTEAEQTLIHTKYMQELVPGRFRAETRNEFVKILQRMAERDRIDALILGGTELSLLFAAECESLDLPLLDTASIHVDAILDYLVS